MNRVFNFLNHFEHFHLVQDCHKLNIIGKTRNTTVKSIQSKGALIQAINKIELRTENVDTTHVTYSKD